jgi:uncharacterized damage-inducible protein DinB
MSESTHLNQFRLMARYNSWVNDRVYNLVASLSQEEMHRDLEAFFGSIHGTLNHLLLSDRTWLGRFATSTSHTFPSLQDAKLIFEFESLGQILYADFTELRRERQETDKVIERWMHELTPEMLSTSLHYHNVRRRIKRKHVLWFGIAHFFNHQTHHRAQVTTLLHQLDRDYGVTDFLAMYDVANQYVT